MCQLKKCHSSTQRITIFAALCYASAAYAIMRCLSVCPSVRPSVCLVREVCRNEQTYLQTRNTFCRTRSLSNATFFIFDHVTLIQFKICCCVQNFMNIGWLFTEIWRCNDFQNGGRPPSWNCFTTIRDHPRSLCCWRQLPVKFHVNLIHRSEEIAIWIFRIFGLKCLFRLPKWGFWGLLTP